MITSTFMINVCLFVCLFHSQYLFCMPSLNSKNKSSIGFDDIMKSNLYKSTHIHGQHHIQGHTLSVCQPHWPENCLASFCHSIFTYPIQLYLLPRNVLLPFHTSLQTHRGQNFLKRNFFDLPYLIKS